MAKVDRTKLQAAEYRLNKWTESLPIADGETVLIEWLGSDWEVGSGWSVYKSAVERPELVNWDDGSWELDWWYCDEYECDNSMLTVRVSWDYDCDGNPYDYTDYTHSEEWSVSDEEVSDEWQEELEEYGYIYNRDTDCWEYEYNNGYCGLVSLKADGGDVTYEASLVDLDATVQVYSENHDSVTEADSRLDDEYVRWSEADKEANNE